jgi:hypothetical protein
MDLKKLIREVLENKDCCTATKPTKAPILNEGMQSRVLMTENMQYHIDNKKPLYETTLPYGSKEYLDLWVEARYLYSRGALNVGGIDKEKITETHLGEYGIFEGQLVPLDMPMLEENSIEEIKLTSAGTMDMIRRVFKDPKLLNFLDFRSFKDFLAYIKGGSLIDYDEVTRDIKQYDQQLAEGILTEDNIAELEKIKKEIEALKPSLSWIDSVTFSSYSGDLDIRLDYELDPQEIKQLSQLASKYNMNLLYKTGKNATLTKRRVPPKYEELNEAEYQGRKVTLNKPSQGDSKKFKVYVKNDKGKVVKVNFGFGGKSAKGKRMVIKDKNPKARAAYRARHNCKNPGPKWKANYWSCKAW